MSKPPLLTSEFKKMTRENSAFRSPETPDGGGRLRAVLRNIFTRFSGVSSAEIPQQHRLPVVGTDTPELTLGEQVFRHDAAQVVYGAERLTKDAANNQNPDDPTSQN